MINKLNYLWTGMKLSAIVYLQNAYQQFYSMN